MMKSETGIVVLTALEPISHHDPQTGGGSNTLTFNRRKQFVRREHVDTNTLPQGVVNTFCEHHQMPQTIYHLASQFTWDEWLSVAYVRLLLDIHNRGEGEGLLSGMERYKMLENRLRTSAVRCHTLHKLWSLLANDLQLKTPPARWDMEIALFWTLPPATQYRVLSLMVERSRSIVTLARAWHTANKAQNEEYAAMQDVFAPESWITPHFDVTNLQQTQLTSMVLDVPSISVNSLRHQMVREPAWLHLCDLLEVEAAASGKGPFTPGAEAIFYNGGNIKAGAVQPSNAFSLAGAIREAYPSLDLLGGVTNSFDLGESKLKMSAWLVCLENADAIHAELPNTKISVFDMLDDVTRTRQATSSGEGQMIYNYETLVQGTQILVEITLTPFTNVLTKGALLAALQYYCINVNIVGGQSARGHGQIALDWLEEFENNGEQAIYESYIRENRERLLDGLSTGLLCTESKNPVVR